MTTFIPITLVGNSLGERHRYLNSLVNEAYLQKLSFQSIQDLPEESAVDRLFKIELASKLRNVDYIIKNLKDEDMLYVSRALKCTWLLDAEYRDIITPAYLEDLLYPEMLTTAVNKMKHWIQLHLKDVERCQEFFQYYSTKNIDLAIKFLWNCSNEFIAVNIQKILETITPKHIKLMSEKCPQAVRIYFDKLTDNKKVLSNYLENEREYYCNLKCLLKVDADLFLNIIEKYFNQYSFPKLSPETTLYIMNKHKHRFDSKPELYTAWLLDMKTLAKCLNSEEIKDLIRKLARADYLGMWFSYKNVESLIKRLPSVERKSFKNEIFVDKSFGEKISEWPYPVPASPSIDHSYGFHIFRDIDLLNERYDYEEFRPRSKKIKSLQYCSEMLVGDCVEMRCAYSCPVRKTYLDKLYDRFRFSNFENTFYELRKELTAESSAQNRGFMFLVLVSKTGGRVEFIEMLLKLLVSQYRNETANVRASVIRSLTKRAAIWRLPESLWALVTEFGHDLGLDGNEAEDLCHEGLHAVVLHGILLSGECKSSIFTAYLRNFSTLIEYKLNSEEKQKIIEYLPKMFLAAIEAEPAEASSRLDMLLQLLKAYGIRADLYPGVMSAIKALSCRDPDSSAVILLTLFEDRIARKQLFKENFAIIQTNDSYLNALKLDVKLLEDMDKFRDLVSKGLDHDVFLRKLMIYFCESKGLAERYQAVLHGEIDKKPRIELARSLAILSGKVLTVLIDKLDNDPKNSIQRRLSAALKANSHLSRPKFNLDTSGWRKAGLKAVANRITVCKLVSIDQYTQSLLKWPRAAKLALILGERKGKEAAAFTTVASLRPSAAIKAALKYLQRRQNAIDPSVWDIVKPAIMQLDLSQPKKIYLRNALLASIDDIPQSIKVDYIVSIYSLLQKNFLKDATFALCHIDNNLTEANEIFIADLINDFTKNLLTYQNIDKSEKSFKLSARVNVRILARHLMLCRSEKELKKKIETVLDPFLCQLEALRKDHDKQTIYMFYLDEFIAALKFNKAFFDTSYVTCLPVFERVTEWMQKELSPIIYFDKFVSVHLTMLYLKSIRQGIKNKPEVFADEVRKENEGVVIVGTVFGRYLAHEIVELMNMYFDSIGKLYAEIVTKYFENNFDCHKSKDKFIFSLLKGFLNDSTDSRSRLVAEKIFVSFYRGDSESAEILKMLKEINDREMKFFFYADNLDEYK